MKTILKISLVLTVFLMFSCDSKEKQIEQLKSEAIEIHDEVMPKLDNIMKLKKSLKTQAESASEEEKAEIQELIISLEEANESMMNWMRNYDPQMKDMSEDEKVEAMKNQKASIQKTKEIMISSISDAEAYLK